MFDEKHLFQPHKPPHREPPLTPCEADAKTHEEMRDVIGRLLRFEERMKHYVEEVVSKITNDNVIFKDSFASSFKTFKDAVSNEVSTFESSISADYQNLLPDFTSQVTRYVEETEKLYTEFTSALNSRLEEYNANYGLTFADFQRRLQTEINTFEATVNTNFKTFTTSMSNSWSTFKDTWETVIQERLNAQDAKISDAELYMKANLGATVATMVGDMKDSGEFADIIEGEVFADFSARTNHMVTPEQYGAVGDGSTDDTNVFINAIANGGVLYGNPSKTYKISGLFVTNVKLFGCNFVGDGGDGIVLGSGATIERCTFSNFNNAIVSGEYNVVSSTIRDCTFQYNKNGVYMNTAGDYSVNKLNIENNYFVKSGVGADDYTGEPTDGVGYGLYLGGNVCGAFVRTNVFEYNTFSGVAVACSNSNYRLSVVITDNYFEGNKNSAIYFNATTRTAHMIAVHNNFFSVLSTNVFVTNYINVNGAIATVYKIEDVNPVECCSKYTNPITHAVELNSSNVTSIELALQPVKMGLKYLRVVYQATLEDTINVSSTVGGSVVFSFENGLHEITIPYATYYALNRVLRDGESIKILHFGE